MCNGLVQHISYIVLLKISFIETFIVLNTTLKTRSGGHPKFPPLFQLEEGIDHEFHSTNLSSLFGEPQMHVDRISNIENDCGRRSVKHYPRRNGKIIGGSAAPYGAYPWQVEIQIYSEDKHVYEHQCGGALVGERLVLTAAHCIHVSTNRANTTSAKLNRSHYN